MVGAISQLRLLRGNLDYSMDGFVIMNYCSNKFQFIYRFHLGMHFVDVIV